MNAFGLALLMAGLVALACKQAGPSSGNGGIAADGARDDERFYMVKWQIESRGVKNERVLAAMRKVPRHRFVPDSWQKQAYDDHPLPIGEGQTISQPYIVGFMTEAVAPRSDMKVLEIGTGSGYQAAILAELVAEVYTIEIVESLGKRAEKTLKELGYKNVQVRVGDGYEGWKEHAPYDAVMLTAAPTTIPQPLLDQLKVGGVLIAPVGDEFQQLRLYTRTASGTTSETLLDVRFVPMTGKALDGEK